MLSDKDKKGIALLGASLFVLAALGGVVAYLRAKPRAHPVTHCLPTITAKTVIVIDQSDALSDQTRAELISRAMAHIEKNARTGELISILTVSDISKMHLAPVFMACKPPADGNALIENRRRIEKVFMTFREQAKERLSQGVLGSRQSPIAQALIDLSLTDYLRAEKASLLVFSDMIENTDRFSLYGCSRPESVIAAFRSSRVGAQERPAFKNTDVRPNIVPRLQLSRDVVTCRDRLWAWFFGDNEGPEAGLISDSLPS